MRLLFFTLFSAFCAIGHSQDVITIKPTGDTIKYTSQDLRSHVDQHTDGKRITFYNKKMISFVEIKNGDLNGYSVVFHSNGKTKSIGTFVKGLKKGRWLYFDEKGRYLKEENY